MNLLLTNGVYNSPTANVTQFALQKEFIALQVEYSLALNLTTLWDSTYRKSVQGTTVQFGFIKISGKMKKNRSQPFKKWKLGLSASSMAGFTLANSFSSIQLEISSAAKGTLSFTKTRFMRLIMV